MIYILLWGASNCQDGRHPARLTDTPLKPEDTHRLVEQLLDEQTIGLFKKGEVGFTVSRD